MTTKIAIVGEAWGEHEESQRAPFVGPAGYELTRMLDEAGIHRAECFLTNVFNLRPKPTNDIENLCCKEKTGGFPALKAGQYLRPEYFGEVSRLLKELRDIRPNIAILLGNTAAWALLQNSGISKIRGTVVESNVIRGLKCMPAYHPAAILREWSLRHVTVLDLMKARRESEFPEVKRPERTVYIAESLADMEWFYETYLKGATQIAADIETARDQITCIGFAPSASEALVIPFHDPRRPSASFWQVAADESLAWKFVRRVLALPCRKLFQNGLYDVHFLWRAYGIPTVNFDDDTMLLHHSLQPESEKGLAFLGSVYTNEASWKLLRQKGKTTIKRDE